MRVGKLLEKLSKGLSEILGNRPAENECRFRSIVLLDDFSASGISYIREENGVYDGKIGSFLSTLFDPEQPLSQLVDPKDLEILVVLYIATEKARNYLSSHLAKMCEPAGVASRVLVVYPLAADVAVSEGDNPALDAIIEKYYDSDNETPSTKLGGTDLKYGFNGCALPVALSHNAPNNSIGLLWAEGSNMRALFPRVTRHKDRV